MARTDITRTKITTAGVAAAAEANGDTVNNHSVDNDGKTFLVVRNADAGGAHNVTLITPGTIGAGSIAVADPVVSVGASTTLYIGPFEGHVFNQSDGKLYFDVDSTELKIVAFNT